MQLGAMLLVRGIDVEEWVQVVVIVLVVAYLCSKLVLHSPVFASRH